MPVIDPALLTLIRLLTKGGLRTAWRLVKRPAGAVVAVFMVVMISFGVLPALTMALTSSPQSPSFISDLLTANLPVVMGIVAALMITTQAGNSLLELRPPELQFVLAGPFSDSQILSYRLATMLIGWIPLSGFFALMMFPHLGSYVGVWLGILFGLSFITLLSLLSTLLRPRVSATVYGGIRLLALGCVTCVSLETAYSALRSTQQYSVEALTELVQSGTAAKVISAPFHPFAELAMSEMGPGLLPPLFLSITLTTFAVFLCYQFNGGFAELAVEGVARRAKKLERIRSGNVYGRSVRKAERKAVLPMLPWWGGLGPVAWSQMLAAVRRTGRLAVSLLLVGIVGAGVSAFLIHTYPNVLNDSQRAYTVPIGMAVAGYIGFLITLTAQTGLTGNARLLIWYQTAPIRPIAIAAGMLAGTATLLTCVLIAFFLPAFSLSNQPWTQSFSILAAAFSIALTYGSMMNLISAATHLRPMPQGTPDVFQGARAMIFMFALGVSMLPATLLAGLAAVAAGGILGFSWTTCSLAVAVTLMVIQPALWAMTGNRFACNEAQTP